MRVRRSIWVIFAIAVCIAVAFPLSDLWHVMHLPVVEMVRIVPEHPSLGQPIHLVVTLHEDGISLAHTSKLVIKTDMRDMPMTFAPLLVSAQGKLYQASLRFTMEGVWSVDLRLDLVAHPSWTSHLTVQVDANSVTMIPPRSGT